MGRWINCEFECDDKFPCGYPPYCASARRGAECETPYCGNCGNGVCVASGQCQSACRCNPGWIGEKCDRQGTLGRGDPWLTTFNGFLYGFQGLGEYWYCLDRANDLGIQIRTYLVSGLSSSVSSISGVAVKLSNLVFTIFLNENNAYVIRLGNEIIPNNDRIIVLNKSLGGMEEIINLDFGRKLIAIDRKKHSTLTIYLNKRNIDINLDLYASLNTKGLCGTSDKLTDEFKG